MIQIKAWKRCDVMPHETSADWIYVHYSLYGGMWNLFCRAVHYPGVHNLLQTIRRRNPPCNAKDNLRVGLVVIEAWFGGLLRESWIRWCPDSRTIPSAGHLDNEDTRLKTSSRVQKGLSLAWKASLAIQICSYHCNRLCVTLALSDVYINRRVLVRRNDNHTIG